MTAMKALCGYLPSMCMHEQGYVIGVCVCVRVHVVHSTFQILVVGFSSTSSTTPCSRNVFLID